MLPMLNGTITHFIGKFGKWLAIAALLGFGLAMAQTAPGEPTLKQIYDTAQAGQLDKAQTMVQQVLVLHPNSAKAHFVQAELFARQGQLPKAREALAAADKLAPGLPFAKSEAIQSLRAQLDAKSPAPAVKSPSANSFGVTPAKPPAAPANTPWGLILLAGGAALALVVFLIRRKPAQTFTPPAPYANPGSNPGAMPGGGLNGPQTFGMGSGAAPGAQGMPGYGQAPGQGYGQQPGQVYGQQPAGSGMGGRLAGGLATGLAVGAGMMAAQAIGKTLTGNDDHGNRHDAGNNNQQPLSNNANNGPSNNDMGGQNFGVEDAGSWDDAGGGGDMGGGGDWDT
jgi:uncharacterized protein